jgi:RND family efflux transporter MFP subunit
MTRVAKHVPNRWRRWSLFTGLSLLIVVLFLLVARPGLPQVEVITIARADAIRVLAVNGRIRPRQFVDVKPPVAGTLIELPYDVGDRVSRGQILARIDDGPQRAAIAQAQASIGAQEAAVAQARRDLARFLALGEFVTRRRVEEARVAVEQGTRELQRLRAGRSEASEVQQRFLVRAPFSGVILERPLDRGQTVGPDAVLYRLADLDAPEITAAVDEVYAAQLRPGTSGVVEIAGHDRRLRAQVVHIEPRVDEGTGAREVRLRFLDAVDSAPAGQTVSVNLIIERRRQAISIPRSSILDPDARPRVRVVGEDGRVAERPIRFIDWPAADVIVTHGLEPSTILLVNPSASQPGARVKPAA